MVSGLWGDSLHSFHWLILIWKWETALQMIFKWRIIFFADTCRLWLWFVLQNLRVQGIAMCMGMVRLWLDGQVQSGKSTGRISYGFLHCFSQYWTNGCSFRLTYYLPFTSTAATTYQQLTVHGLRLNALCLQFNQREWNMTLFGWRRHSNPSSWAVLIRLGVIFACFHYLFLTNSADSNWF